MFTPLVDPKVRGKIISQSYQANETSYKYLIKTLNIVNPILKTIILILSSSFALKFNITHPKLGYYKTVPN